MDTFIQFKGENEIEFAKPFADKDKCYTYLAHHKWKYGFVCPHCMSIVEHACSMPNYKRCAECERLISPTANTIFHNVKFGIVKAFHMVFKMSATTKSISAEQLSKAVRVNRKTALSFQHQIRLAMQSSGQHPLEGQVDVDEAFIGQQE